MFTAEWLELKQKANSFFFFSFSSIKFYIYKQLYIILYTLGFPIAIL